MTHINPKLYDNEVIHDPWPHMVVDNFFSEKTWEKISQIPNYILDPLGTCGFPPNEFLTDRVNQAKEKKRGGNVFSLEDLLLSEVPEDVVECLWDACYELLQNREKIWDQFPERKSGEEYLIKPCVNLDFQGNWLESHPDAAGKIISFVCYLEPEKSEGTNLHLDYREESVVKVMDWKPNRCTVFCPTDKTWHSYKCPTYYRMVFAIFIEVQTGDKLKNHIEFSSGKTAEFWCDY